MPADDPADGARVIADDYAGDRGIRGLSAGHPHSNDPSKINDLVPTGADNADDADDPGKSGAGERPQKIVLNGRGARATLRIVPRSPAAPSQDAHRCAQCDGEPDGKELLHTVRGEPTWLHRECARFFRPPVDPPEAA
jgi:hypothetical protein